MMTTVLMILGYGLIAAFGLIIVGGVPEEDNHE